MVAKNSISINLISDIFFYIPKHYNFPGRL